MTMIRAATHDDIPRLAELGRQMHVESRFARLPLDDGKVRALFVELIESADGLLIVAENGGEVIGGFAGYVCEHYFARTLVAGDYALFIAPEHRGGMAAPRLLKAYVAWAKSRGAVMIQAGITTGVHVEATTQLYQRLGFQPAGALFEIAA
jgi:GNAT superfamily N-acetyltransferase